MPTYSPANLQNVITTKALAAAGDYAAEDVLSQHATTGTAWEFTNMARGEGLGGVIWTSNILWETTALTPRITLYLFNVTPTSAVNDNVANTAVIHADDANYVGKIEYPALSDNGGDSDSIVTPGVGNLPLFYKCAAGDTSLYGIAVTEDAITGEVATKEMTIKHLVEHLG